jgi:hypothetical protein
MPRGVLIAQTRPSDPSREEEYNHWYSRVHVPELLAIPGFVGARRYKVSEGSPGGVTVGADGYPYIAVFELEADDLDGVIGELGARAADGRMQLTDAIEVDPPPILTVYELIE